jgi:hypothetical protein
LGKFERHFVDKADSMKDTHSDDYSRIGPLQGQIVEERYGYYRRCQRFRKNGQQCKAPAMKDTDRCYKHQEQADIERRRRAQYTLPPLVDLKTVQRAIGDVAQALIQDRIDEDYAGELLQELEMASIRLRPTTMSR